tara:strand:- start:2175 stop:3800 length:1626 start_codon:yes stop_codon:yes gene_type:complete
MTTSIIPQNLQLRSYQPFLDSNPINVRRQKYPAQTKGQEVNFYIQPPSRSVLLDATNVILEFKGELTAKQYVAGTTNAPVDLTGAQIIERLANQWIPKFNAVQNAIASIDIGINHGSVNYQLGETSTVEQYLLCPDYATKDALCGGGPTKVYPDFTWATGNVDINGSYARYRNWKRSLNNTGVNSNDPVAETKVFANSIKFTLFVRLTSPPFWNGHRNVLTGQFSNMIPHMNDLNIRIRFAAQNKMIQSLFESVQLPDIFPSFTFDTDNFCNLHMTWVQPAANRAPPMSLPISLFDVQIKRSNNTFSLGDGGVQKVEFPIIQTPQIPKWLVFYVQPYKEATTYAYPDRSAYSTAENLTNNNNYGAEIAADALPRITKLGLRINVSNEVLDLTLNKQQMYALTMENIKHFPFIQSDFYTHRNIIVLASNQIAGMTLPQGVKGVSAQIEITSFAVQPLTNSDLYQAGQTGSSGRDMKYYAYANCYNSNSFMNITPDRATFNIQQTSTVPAKQVVPADVAAVTSSRAAPTRAAGVTGGYRGRFA